MSDHNSDFERCFAALTACVSALDKVPQWRFSGGAANQLLAEAEAALNQGMTETHQSARSMASFLASMQNRYVDEYDLLQLHQMLDNLQRELDNARAATSAFVRPPAPPLSPPAPTEVHSNNRIALYIESRAASASLEEGLSCAGFSPRVLASIPALTQTTPHNHPLAIVADLSLCLRDSSTQASIAALRDRFTPAVHLFALAEEDDVTARLQAVRLGATRFLKKPVDNEQLIALLSEVSAGASKEAFRVLFIDDDACMTALYSAAMDAVGVDVRCVNDPLAAPALVAEFMPEVIVTDLYMPGCSGLELAALLRQDESLADTIILLLSSETHIERQLAALDLGVDDFLSKPIDVAELQAVVIARAKRARLLKSSRREFQRKAEHQQSVQLAIDKHSIVSIGDLDGTILYANQRFCDVSGYDKNELLGANHRITQSGVHPAKFYRELWTTINRGRTWHGEMCNCRKDGSFYWVDATITPQFDKQGLPARYISVRTDITLLKEMQAQLMVAKAEAEAASQAKTVFLANMSHELKTPLNSVLGFSQLMQSDTQTPPAPGHAEMLGAIERAGQHLLTLISSLVDLARIETGHFGLQMAMISLPTLIRDCLFLLRPQAQKRGITITLNDLDGPCQVYADSIRVKQVLLNLLSNAIKYNRDKGSVTITCQSMLNSCQVTVKDTGAGIDSKDQGELFKPFSRLRSTEKQAEGTGIGLALSKNLIERMGGQIGVISAPGAGSEFWFELPTSTGQERIA